jgi:hypothetical protein
VENNFTTAKLNFAPHRAQPRDVVRPESLGKRMRLDDLYHRAPLIGGGV